MEKITFQKAIDTLKNTECSSAVKIAKFNVIQESLLSSSLQSNSNYKTFLSNAVTIFLLFCEENDSTIRISAEENLNKIIRNCENNSYLVIVQIDLYHELKKNGNERSLRICLNIFANYCHLIKHRRKKIYAQNLLPCLLAIGKRKEPMLVETLTEFLKYFSQNLLVCLTDGEILKFLDLFLDNIIVECPIKRRCSAQNIITLLENASSKKYFFKHVLRKTIEQLTKSNGPNTLLGMLGLLRLLIPVLVKNSEYNQKVLECMDICLNFLKTELNHSIVNATLEVLNSLLTSAKGTLKFLLIDDKKMLHKEMLLGKRSVSALRTNESRKSSAERETTKMLDVSRENFLQIPSTSTSIHSTPNKSIDFSDVEGDSFKSIDFETEMSSSPSTVKNMIERGAETMSLKSTDSINSFFNSINTETVSKFFRSQKSTESPTHTPKPNEFINMDKTLVDCSTTDVESEPDSQTLYVGVQNEEFKPFHDDILDKSSLIDSQISTSKDVYIGTIFDQSVVEYIVRLVASKFLLTGVQYELISDQEVRVSIKNMAFYVIANCVLLKSDLLLISLKKDYNNQSLLVESLLSYFVDEDIRENDDGEDESKQHYLKYNQEVAKASDNFLEIKDDHFGECTTATFLDYFSPMGKSLDNQGLISLKNKLFEKTDKRRDESTKKINQELCELLTRSVTVEQQVDSDYPLLEKNMKSPDNKDTQYIIDILLFFNHTDPVLRGHCQAILGNFLVNIFQHNYDYEKFVKNRCYLKVILEEIELENILEKLIKGLEDDIHTVVKQSLVALEMCLNHLLLVTNRVQLLMDKLLMVFHNKYWLVQNKYCDVITKIDFNVLREVMNYEKVEVYQKQIMNQIFQLMKDNDFRIRNQACNVLPKLILQLANHQLEETNCNNLEIFVKMNVLNFDAFFIDVAPKWQFNKSIEFELAKVLYQISNCLIEFKDKNKQFGLIFALKILIKEFDPLTYIRIWREFNILNILLNFVNRNMGIALDLSCQCDMLEVCSALVAAENIMQPHAINTESFLVHLVKIINIYGHLVSNTKPLIVAKSQKSKNDLFASNKELAIINSIGFFSGDPFYLKLYLILKSSYESYRITMNKESEQKLKQLLHISLKSLQTLIEFATVTKDSQKMLEEVVRYLVQLIHFQPEDCVTTTIVLTKFLFQRNYLKCLINCDKMRVAASASDGAKVFEMFEEYTTFDAGELMRDKSFEHSIKCFDPVVIQSLRLFSKAHAVLQSLILDMLCQLLEFNVNYMALDSKKVFVDFVMKQLEYIENCLVLQADILGPKIVQFLICLTKVKDKKLLTIPKIINIIDNLLATTNVMVKNCGVQALIVLVMELFFRKNYIKPDDKHPEMEEAFYKEINTQREVVFSMMMKFLNHPGMHQQVSWILAKSKNVHSIEGVIGEKEIYQQLILSLKDGEQNHFKSSLLYGSISKNTLLDSQNFEEILIIYFGLLKKVTNYETLSFISIINDNILVKAETIYFETHLKLYAEKNGVEEDDFLFHFLLLQHQKLISALSYLHVCENPVKTLEIVGRILKFLKFKQFPGFLSHFKAILDVKNVVELAVGCSFDIKDLITYLLAIGVTKDEILQSVSVVKDVDEDKFNAMILKNMFEHKMIICDWNNEELMEFVIGAKNLEFLMNFASETLISEMLDDETYSKLIVSKLGEVKIKQEMMKYILDKVHHKCLVASLEFVIVTSTQNGLNSTSLQLMMAKKLHSIKNELMLGIREPFSELLVDFVGIVGKCKDLHFDIKFPTFFNSINVFVDFLRRSRKKEAFQVDESNLNQMVDETWILKTAKLFISGRLKRVKNGLQIAEMLHEIKSESKLINLLTKSDFNITLLSSTFHVCFVKMLENFRIDCIQINPHLNYMKMAPLLKISIVILMKNLEKIIDEDGEIRCNDTMEELAKIVKIYLSWIKELYQVSLVYVEARLVEKFISDSLLKSNLFKTLLKFLEMLVNLARIQLKDGKLLSMRKLDQILNGIKEMLSEFRLWQEFNQNLDFQRTSDSLIELIHDFIIIFMSETEFLTKYEHPQLFDEIQDQKCDTRIKTIRKVIFIAKFEELYRNGMFKDVAMLSEVRKLLELILKLSKPVLRLQRFYQFAITPYEILISYRSVDNLLLLDENFLKLQQIPIEYLSDTDLLEFYIRRITWYGYTQRQEFEEYFMTLLVLLNQWNEIQDAEEQFYIRKLCLETNVDLLLSCFKFPVIGVRENSFFHLPRLEKIKMESIGMKKLHHIQESLSSQLNVFYQPNLEQISVKCRNSSIGMQSFGMNQFALNYTWQLVETNNVASDSGSCLSRNINYLIDKSGVDFKSALQLIYDIMTQMIEDNPVLVLPQLSKIVEILDNIEQFKWINKKMLSLYETIPSEDTISHQYISYLLCRSYAVLVPTLNDLQSIQPIVNKYLNNNQLYVRIATLQGLLCLFESVFKTNTTIGKLNDELMLLRSVICNYITKNGIIVESSNSSTLHDQLVWTLNFYVIETTSKFIGDCDLLGDSVISANNTLKRTNDFDLYHLILNGLERLVIINPCQKMYREKVEKLALDLLKMDNKLYSMGGLKLLISCLYVGSLEQLENTDKSNGIVQDEPEIIIQSTEKIEILFHRIRTATSDEAEIYGQVLGQMVKDLLPPNEILTKVIKELLIMNQSNTVIIAKIIHQVFRSAIDSSYLVLLQEWLICSLQNFLSYPNAKKSIWFLTLIFLSSTLNLNLLKLFPVLLDENIPNKELYQLFLVCARDFYDKLTPAQQQQFKEPFTSKVKTKMMSTSPMSINPTNNINNLFHILLEHL
ncbi:unnamed protein product [Diamesa serratosioi]